MKGELKRILCPVDFSRYAAYAARYALAFAESYRAEVLLLQVEEPGISCGTLDYAGVDGISPFYAIGEMSVQRDDTSEPELDEDSKLNRLAEDLRVSHHGVAITPLRTVGRPFVEIVRTAREREVDLIVMGTHGRTGLIGSTAEKVVRMAPCPVLTVKSPEHKFAMP